MVTTIIIVAVLALLVLWAVLTYNSMKGKHLAVDTARSDMAVQLQRRGELIPRLVNTVKGAADFEKTTLKDVIAQRTLPTISKDSTTDELKAFDTASRELMNGINVAVEAYPALQATANFGQLQDELAHTENMVAASRNAFNGRVLQYNQAIAMFPNSLLASMFKFKEEASFELTDKSLEAAPEVSF